MDARNSSQTVFSPCLTASAFSMRRPRQTDISTPIHFFPAASSFPKAGLRQTEGIGKGAFAVSQCFSFVGKEALRNGAGK
jgi:hypothetical protein